MAAYQGKFHIGLGDVGFILAKGARTQRHTYMREEAPTFVNKFSSGEPNYRDSTFFPHWVQLNFLNGFNQEFFDDGGKYYRSASVDTTEVQKLKLERNFTSAGITGAGYKNKTQVAWRASQNWWNNSYLYRKQLTVKNNASTTMAAGYPIKITEDTAPLVTAAKVRADRKDWRIVFWNGTSWVDLTRHYAAAALTVFGLQAELAAGATSSDYYIYYGNSGETTSKDPANNNDWNAVYGMYGTTLDANTLGLWHFKEGSGGTVADTDAGQNLTMGGGATWSSSGTRYGFAGEFAGGAWSRYDDSSNVFNLGSISVEMLIKPTNVGGTRILIHRRSATQDTDYQYWSVAYIDNRLRWTFSTGNNNYIGNILLDSGSTYWVAATADGNGNAKLYLNGNLVASGSGYFINSQTGNNQAVFIGGKSVGGSDTFNGQISHVRVSNVPRTSFPYVLSAEPTYTITEEVGTQPLSSSFTHLVGSEDGGIYSWDGVNTYTELFNTRRIVWYESGVDNFEAFGDTAGTEYEDAQSFQIPAGPASVKIKALQLYLKKNAGTPGAITVRIETDNSNKPSGTLAHANATATIVAFTDTNYSWKTADFTDTFTLTAATKYWIRLKIAAGSNDNNYGWAKDGSSSSYSSGDAAYTTNAGSNWTVLSGHDLYFRVLGNPTSVNCSLVSAVGGSQKAYFGTGDPAGTVAGDARLYSYDGSTFALVKAFTGSGESCILSLAEFGTTTTSIFIGLGSKASIYSTTDMSTFTLSKTITKPNNPGYVFAMIEYNGRLYAGGGFPEQLPGNNYQYSGFVYAYDEFSWVNVFPFDHTVVTAFETFDSLLFIGTIKRRIYVFNTASVDKLLEMPWDVAVTSMTKFDDKLAIAIAATPGTAKTGNEGVYIFDRNGFHNAYNATGKAWHSVFVFNNNLMVGSDDGYVYQTSPNTYISQGTLQTSYDEASLPSIPKIRRSVQLMYESLPVGTSISISYKYDEQDSAWTSLGTASVAGSTEATFNFVNGSNSKKISYLVTLITADNTKTPVLKKILHKYILSPDFKYRWNMTLMCADNIVWMDNTEPVAFVQGAITAGSTEIALKSNNDLLPSKGFPDVASGGYMYATVVEPNGQFFQFRYSGKTGTSLTGIPTTGTYALTAHPTGSKVVVLGRDLHQKILDMKAEKKMITFTDIDGIQYQAYFHAYQTNNWVINQDNWYGAYENEVPITLLEV